MSQRPWTVQALRIGAVRDGSKIGVLAYSQELSHPARRGTPALGRLPAPATLRDRALWTGTRYCVLLVSTTDGRHE